MMIDWTLFQDAIITRNVIKCCTLVLYLIPFAAQIHRLSQAENLILELDFSTNLVEDYQGIFGHGAHLESEHGPNFKCASEFNILLEKVATSFLAKKFIGLQRSAKGHFSEQ
jgi:hypothetical protein